MNLEKLVTNMMELNNLSRLWHWGTDIAQHHVVYEKFLTQNEALTDSFVESALGNDVKFDIGKIIINSSVDSGYSLESARGQISSYRKSIRVFQSKLDESDGDYSAELVAILDDVIELSSKTLYLLNLK